MKITKRHKVKMTYVDPQGGYQFDHKERTFEGTINQCFEELADVAQMRTVQNVDIVKFEKDGNEIPVEDMERLHEGFYESVSV